MRIGLKLLVTAVVGGLTYLLTGIGDQREMWRAAVAVAVGAFTLVAQLIIEAAEASRRLELARRANAPARREVTHLVTAGTSAPPATPVIDLDGLRDGRDGRSGRADEDPDWLLGLTETATMSIDAVTMASFGEGEFWTSDLGRQYLDRQRAAIDRNVRIRRLFLLTERLPDPDRLRALLAPHDEIGVETRLIRPDDIYFVRQTDLEDFIVFDQKVSYEFHTARVLDDSVTPPIAGVALVVDPRLVKKRQERFEQLWTAAARTGRP
ncbi:DUF6879 family protein [Actinoplanes sp. NPDC026619]|uniref:DUF6879 family protein n=1 Tax=Actinoplanes sp. NPDC026619 TaxID=3155798 RepID=UPI0033F6E985